MCRDAIEIFFNLFYYFFPGEQKNIDMARRLKLGWLRQLLVGIMILQLLWLPLSALDPESPVHLYLVDHWGTADGLPAGTVGAIAQTPDGYLWLATANGLVRFDGIKFSIIPFVKKEDIAPRETAVPYTLLKDLAGTLWIGSSAGLTSYLCEMGRFRTFTTAHGLNADRIRRLACDMNGNLWISFMTRYVSRFSGGKFTTFGDSHGLFGKKINAIVQDRKGQLLFASRENGVFKYRDGRFSSYPIDGLKNRFIVAMHEDHKGDLWIGTPQGLLRVTDKGSEMYHTGHGLANDFITAILEDSEHNLWIGTIKGLSRARRQASGEMGFETFLQPVNISCLFEDREKSLWVGTDGAGLKRVKDGKFTSYSPIKSYPDEILSSLFQDRQGGIWIGTHSGRLFRCRGNQLIESPVPPDITGTIIAAIAEDTDGHLWLGTNGKGVFQRKKETFVRFTSREGLADNLVTSIFKDSRGHLWFCTFDGVSVFRHPKGVIESLTEMGGLSGKRAHNVYEDKAGNIWIAADKGITVLKAGQIAGQNISHYLPGLSVTCIHEDPSPPAGEGPIFWIATEGAGLKRLRLSAGTVTSYTTGCGMTTDFIYQFLEDRAGYFWLMSNSGILRLKKSELNLFPEGSLDQIDCISFSTSDGLLSTEFNNELSRHSTLKTTSGQFWFLTKKGISIVNPDRIRINKTPPPVVIEEVIFNEKPISLPLDEKGAAFKGKGNIRFRFTAATLLSSEKVLFKLRLQGFDKKWLYLPAGKEREARYRNLAPGTYTFTVTARNGSGVWNQTGASLAFTLKPLFYQTALFKIALFLLFSALVSGTILIYKKRSFKKKIKYKDSPLNPHFAEECIKRLKKLLELDRVYRDEKLTLNSLAEKLGVQPYILSQLLNEKLGRSFSDYINSFRIEEARTILASPGGAGKKIITIAHEVGFKTMTAFYKAFKKYTHTTPKQYQEQHTDF